jgi:hypothetical protein
VIDDSRASPMGTTWNGLELTSISRVHSLYPLGSRPIRLFSGWRRTRYSPALGKSSEIAVQLANPGDFFSLRSFGERCCRFVGPLRPWGASELLQCLRPPGRQFSPTQGAQAGDTAPCGYQEAREDLSTDYFWILPNWMQEPNARALQSKSSKPYPEA